MLIRWFLLRVLICLAFALANPLQAATMEPQLRDLAFLEDAGGHETITSIANSAAHFQPLSGGTFSGGYTRNAYWMRFEPDQLIARAGQGIRQGFRHAAPISAN